MGSWVPDTAYIDVSLYPIQRDIWTIVNMSPRIGKVNTPTATAEHIAAQVPDECCAGSMADLIPAPDADTLATVFKALADPTRVRLLHYLAFSDSGTACACHLPDALGISQPTLSFHMKRLHDAGLVTRDKRGRWVHWTVRADALRVIRHYLEMPDQPGATCC